MEDSIVFFCGSRNILCTVLFYHKILFEKVRRSTWVLGETPSPTISAPPHTFLNFWLLITPPTSCFTCSIIFNTLWSFLFPLYNWEKWGSEKLNIPSNCQNLNSNLFITKTYFLFLNFIFTYFLTTLLTYD